MTVIQLVDEHPFLIHEGIDPNDWTMDAGQIAEQVFSFV